MIELVILGVAIVHNLIAVWFDTNMPVHLFRLCYWIRRKPFPEEAMTMDWKGYATIKWGAFGELLTCPICLATHLSWATAGAICFACGRDLSSTAVFAVIAALTWPGVVSFLRRK